VYYRDGKGREPVNAWLESLFVTKPADVAKIDEFVEEYLNGRGAEAPPTKFPVTSQIKSGLRELRVRVGHTRYRLLYQRSDNLFVLLHGLEKNTGELPDRDRKTAEKAFADFKERMNANPRQGPRAAGHDAPSRRGLER
jgi:phage-related protein